MIKIKPTVLRNNDGNNLARPIDEQIKSYGAVLQNASGKNTLVRSKVTNLFTRVNTENPPFNEQRDAPDAVASASSKSTCASRDQ